MQIVEQDLETGPCHIPSNGDCLVKKVAFVFPLWREFQSRPQVYELVAGEFRSDILCVTVHDVGVAIRFHKPMDEAADIPDEIASRHIFESFVVSIVDRIDRCQKMCL